MSSKRVSIIDQMTEDIDNENANSENDMEQINLPSEIKVSETRKTAESKILEAISRLNNAKPSEPVSEEEEEYEETQTLTIVPQHMENNPNDFIEMFNSNEYED